MTQATHSGTLPAAKQSEPTLAAKYHSTQSHENLRETTARRINKNKPNQLLCNVSQFGATSQLNMTRLLPDGDELSSGAYENNA